ncbi:MAG: MFS transporter [Chloroflexota bacterium]
MQLTMAPARRIAEPFQVRAYRSLWLGAVLAATAQWIDRVAVGWYIFHITDSAFLTSAGVSAQMGPGFFIGPIAGAISDRSSRPAILAAGIGLRCCTIAAMALLVYSGVQQVSLIFVLLALGGVGQSMLFASQQTLSSDLVGADRRARAISLMSIGQRVVSAFGAVGSGLLVGSFGPTVALLVAVCATAAASLSYMTITEPREKRASDGRSLFGETIRGLQVVARVPLAAILLGMMVVVEVFGFSFFALVPAIAQRVVHVGPTGLGGLNAATSVGGVIGLLFLATYSDRLRMGIVFLCVFGGFGALMIVVGSAPWYLVSLLAASGIGCCAALIDALEWILLQQSVPDALRGRALGSWNVAIGFGWIVGPLTLGALADATSVSAAFALAGSIVLVTCAIASVVSSRLRTA